MMAVRTGVCAVLTTLCLALSAAAGVQVTIYNSDLALVKDTRTLPFERGTFDLSFTDVAAAIDPTSVAFAVPGHPDAVTLLEQNYRYDLVSAEKVLARYLDRTLQVLTKQDKLIEGVLLAVDGGALTLQRPDGGLTIVSRAEITEYSCPDLPEGLITRPTLVWKLNSTVDGGQDAEVRYLTGRLGWHAEYVATVNEAEDALNISGWVSIDNRCGATYDDATIKLIAGDVHRVQERREAGMYDMAMAARAPKAFEEQQFFEYHMYTLTRPSTLRDNEIKQLALFEPADVAAKKVYTYDGAMSGDNVQVSMEFVNSEAAGLGIPLPGGKIRVMKADSDGSLQFVGEDLVDHTPKDEEVRVRLGNAFDVVGERKQMDHRQISNRVSEDDFSITLRNHKDTPVTVVVVEHMWGDWTITVSSREYEKKDAGRAEWRLPVPANGEAEVRFTVRRRM